MTLMQATIAMFCRFMVIDDKQRIWRRSDDLDYEVFDPRVGYWKPSFPTSKDGWTHVPSSLQGDLERLCKAVDPSLN